MESVRETADLDMDANLDAVRTSVLGPLPAAAARARLEHEGRILETRWDNYTVFNSNIRHPHLSTTQLEDGVLDIYRLYYSEEAHTRSMQYFKAIHKALLTSGLHSQRQG